ncbi:MAG TPA: thioesterase family protein [Verrucomicrobiae bacterium]|nr:thioesterase family protein [Verrucomicrobiae bacterium]
MQEPVFRHQHRVTYAECTVGNHVYYARYLEILEAARGEFFRDVGLPLLPLQLNGAAFPVIGLRLAYKAQARYDDLLTIELWINDMRGVRLNFGFRILHSDGRLIAEGETQHVCAGMDERPSRLPKELTERFQPFVRPHKNAD